MSAVAMALGEGEPAVAAWRVVRLTESAGLVLDAAGAPTGRPPIVALDGRSPSGKTTLARRLEVAIPGAVTVHTDDIAWWHSCFGWRSYSRTGCWSRWGEVRPFASGRRRGTSATAPALSRLA
jgi:hypothetical protein